jgi:hypothetical protein
MGAAQYPLPCLYLLQQLLTTLCSAIQQMQRLLLQHLLQQHMNIQ